MKKYFILFIAIILATKSNAQNVGIGTTAPNASAALEIKATNKGFLPPRIALKSTSDITTIPAPANGLMVFNTTTAGSGASLVSTGYYYFSDGLWMPFKTAYTNLVWALGGNANTDPVNNFIGTTDARPLVFRVNNSYSGRIDNTGMVALGLGAAHVLSDPSIVAIGNSALYNNGTGASGAFQALGNTAIGNSALYANTLGYFNTATGGKALYANVSGILNTANGFKALTSNTTGDNNTAIGSQALAYNTTGFSNSANGTQALFFNTSGSGNTAIGKSALYSNTIGSNNEAIGDNALHNNISGYENIAIGSNALSTNTTGDGNVALGRLVMSANINGSNNYALGNESLYKNSSGNYNVAIGYQSNYQNATGDRNVAIGYTSGPTTGVLTNTTSIGTNTHASTSNTMAFGDASVDKWTFGNTSTYPGQALIVGSNPTNGNGANLTVGGVWTNSSDSTKKEGMTVLDGASLLNKIKQLPITRWKYKGTDEYHIGPMAQDFYSLFKLGINNISISSIDPAGIALRGIQAQQIIIETQQTQIAALQKDMAELRLLIGKKQVQ